MRLLLNIIRYYGFIPYKLLEPFIKEDFSRSRWLASSLMKRYIFDKAYSTDCWLKFRAKFFDHDVLSDNCLAI